MNAEQIHKMLDDFGAALEAAAQEVGVMHGRFHEGVLTPEDVDKATDWQDEFEVLLWRLTELADKCESAMERLSEVLYG